MNSSPIKLRAMNFFTHQTQGHELITYQTQAIPGRDSLNTGRDRDKKKCPGRDRDKRYPGRDRDRDFFPTFQVFASKKGDKCQTTVLFCLFCFLGPVN